MYDGRNTLSINVIVVDEEEEAKDGEGEMRDKGREGGNERQRE